MSMPFYVSPEQLMKDRADFARKGIARGRSVMVVQYADGLLFVAENPSQALHKISELYDRLAFAAVGRYNEFENLRIAGVRLADMRGYSYDRRDVTGRALANAYAQTLGTIFSSGGEKPYEVELFVAEVYDEPEEDQVYRLTYDGSVADEHEFAVMGGSAEQVSSYLRENYREGLQLEAALRLAVDALAHDSEPVRSIRGDKLEAAVLDRTRSQPRKFRRIPKDTLTALFGSVIDDVDSTADEQPPAGAGDVEALGTQPVEVPVDVPDDPSETVDDAAGVEPVDVVPDDPSDAVGDLPDEPDPARDE
jgi:proteasome alpha subunit